MTERPVPLGFDHEETRALDAIGLRGAGSRLSGCPDPALVLALDEGVLDDEVATRVRAHVRACPACRTAAAHLAAVFDENVAPESRQRIDALVAAGRPKPPRGFWFWLVPAGGLAAAALALLIFWPRQPPLPPPETQIARAAPPIPSVFVVDRPAIPPGEIDLTLRGALTPAEVDNRAALALDQADAGDVTAALTVLTGLVRDYPASRRAGLALGALQLRADRNADAVVTLDLARAAGTHPELADEVDWFLSIALVRTGDRARARGLLEAVCKSQSARSARACGGVAEIDRK